MNSKNIIDEYNNSKFIYSNNNKLLKRDTFDFIYEINSEYPIYEKMVNNNKENIMNNLPSNSNNFLNYKTYNPENSNFKLKKHKIFSKNEKNFNNKKFSKNDKNFINEKIFQNDENNYANNSSKK